MKATYEKLDAIRAADGPPGLPKALGGTNIYDGGALVLYALSRQIGRRTFDKVMREWVKRFKDSTYTSEEVTGDPSLDAFLRDWIFGALNPPMPGHPDWKAAA
ncbi:hypothetical protein ACWC9U_04535 [Streptomyces sp. 900116325]